MTQPCSRCGAPWISGLHQCPDGMLSARAAQPIERMPHGNEGAALTGTPDPAVDRIVIARLAVLLGGVSYATAREWLIYHAARFRGMGEEDFKALIKD